MGTTWTRIIAVFTALLGVITLTAAPAFAGAAPTISCQHQLSFDPTGPIGGISQNTLLSAIPVFDQDKGIQNVTAFAGYGVMLTSITGYLSNGKTVTAHYEFGTDMATVDYGTLPLTQVTICGTNKSTIDPASDATLIALGQDHCNQIALWHQDPVAIYLDAVGWQHQRDFLQYVMTAIGQDPQLPNFNDIFPAACNG